MNGIKLVVGKSENYLLMQQPKNETRALAGMDSLAKLMDSQFKIPGTNIRFGLDAIIGLIPYGPHILVAGCEYVAPVQ